MSKIDELIQELCPDGVEFVMLEKFANLTNGLNPRKFFTLNTSDATYPYITVRELNTFDLRVTEKTDLVNEAALERIQNRARVKKDSVLFSSTGTVGRTALVSTEDITFGVKEGIYVINVDDAIMNPRFLVYCLGSKWAFSFYEKSSEGGTVKSVSMSKMAKMLLPVPPLKIQKEIVRILDSFTELEKELEKELFLRQKQYEYYRDDIFNFEPNRKTKLGRMVKELCPDGVERKLMGDVSEIIRGGSLQKTDFVSEGVPCIHYGQIYTQYDMFPTKSISFISEVKAEKQKFAQPNDVIMAVTSENVEDICKSIAWFGDDDVAVGGHTAIIKHSLNAKFLVYYFGSSEFQKAKKKLIQGTKVMELAPSKLSKVEIPVPPLAVQEEAVHVLDGFHALTSDISIGLPAEIEARRKQYEYYRDKLLTFEEKVS